MAKKSLSVRAILLAILCILIIIGISAIFILQMNQMVERTTMNTISELAEHDLVAIQNFISTKWYELRSMGERIKIYHCKTIEEVQFHLNTERSTSDFHTIALVAEDGTVYTDTLAVYPREEMDIYSYLEGEEPAIARRFHFTTAFQSPESMLLYATRLSHYEIDGVRFVAIVGISDMMQIQDNMVIYSFQRNGRSRGYSSIINLNGDCIVNVNRTSSPNEQQNMYEMLKAGTLESEWSIDVIKQKMENDESFYFDYRDEDNIKKLGYFMPIQNTIWYFVMIVEKEVFTEQSRTFIVSSLSMLVIAVVISVSLLSLLMHSRSQMLKADAEAKARSEFLSSMSHEIRTPLNGIIGLLYLMRTHLRDREPEQMADWLEKAHSTANYLLSLVSDILDMSKLQAGKLDLVMEPFLLEPMLNSVWSMQRANVEGRGVKLVLDTKITVPCIIGDETRVKQILMNIVGNAAKFTPQGGLIRVSAWQQPPQDGQVTTVLRCSDTGIGMNPQFLTTIWDSFSQEHNKKSDGTRGTGLGMAITKRFVDAMGGTITVESELNVGSTFTVTLPATIATLPVTPATASATSGTPSVAFSDFADSTDSTDSADSTGSTSSAGSSLPAATTSAAIPHTAPLRLLIAEDNELNAEILLEILEGEGFETTLAENGQLAVEAFAASEPNTFDAILMDMQMPVLDGCEATAQIRQLSRPDAQTVTIFACTANSFQEDKDRALRSGMNDFLTKPIDVDALLRKLREWKINP